MESSIERDTDSCGSGVEASNHETERLAYNARIAEFRDSEYPQLKDQIYLDHAGTTIPSASLLATFAKDLSNNLYGNPHSIGSTSAQRTSSRIDDVRLKVLRLFNAKSEDYDVVFVANATAGIKLVAEAFANQPDDFEFYYHKDSHTSLVGVRELATRSTCFENDRAVEEWLTRDQKPRQTSRLFAYPAQSNMNGRLLPLDWCRRARPNNVYTLLDVAALVTSRSLDLGPGSASPDFVVVSFYKMFGFPDLGALLVRKGAAHIFQTKRYFGGGTVETVSCEVDEQWHIKKNGIHEKLEDGTLPIHNIIALDLAIDNHYRLFGNFADISRHATFLAHRLYQALSTMYHGNGLPVCEFYNDRPIVHGIWVAGPVIALNFRDSNNAYISNHEVLKLASIKNIHIRTGNLCNPGGVSHVLKMDARGLRDKYSAGIRCGGDQDLLHGRPTGVIRVSFGAMSTLDDVEAFVSFVKEFFIQDSTVPVADCTDLGRSKTSQFHIESLIVYPIKSCGGYTIPRDFSWFITSAGLAWDREWCLVHQGTRAVLNQKRHPQLALFSPHLDLKEKIMHIIWRGPPAVNTTSTISIPLSAELNHFMPQSASISACSMGTCSDNFNNLIYKSPEVHDYFSSHLGLPVYLTRGHPPTFKRTELCDVPPPAQDLQTPGIFPTPPPTPTKPLMTSRPPSPNPTLANESPVLVLFQPSLDKINSLLPPNTPPIPAEAFRANIILSTRTITPLLTHDKPTIQSHHQPLSLPEDTLSSLRLTTSLPSASASGTRKIEHNIKLNLLSPCKRCQMISIDQTTAKRKPEIFSHLAKIRRWGGGVWFGVHASLDGQVESELGDKDEDEGRVEEGEGVEEGQDEMSGQMGMGQEMVLKVGDLFTGEYKKGDV